MGLNGAQWGSIGLNGAQWGSMNLNTIWKHNETLVFIKNQEHKFHPMGHIRKTNFGLGGPCCGGGGGGVCSLGSHSLFSCGGGGGDIIYIYISLFIYKTIYIYIYNTYTCGISMDTSKWQIFNIGLNGAQCGSQWM